MDAAQLTRKIALFLGCALLLASAASAQDLVASPSTVTFTPVVNSQQVQLTMSDASSGAFTVTNTAGWFTVSPMSGSSLPATLTVTLNSSCVLVGGCPST